MNNCLASLRKKPCIFFDSTTKNVMSIQLNDNYLTIQVNGRYYYFNTEDGKYDGYSDKTDITVIDKTLPTQIDLIFSQE